MTKASTLLLLFLVSFVTFAGELCNLNFRRVKEALLVEEDVLLKDVDQSFNGLRPFTYEVELAKHSQLEVEEVMGLTRNFHDDLVTTGETGIYRINNEFKYLPENNLVKAYKQGMKDINLGKINADDIIKLRKSALEFKYEHQGQSKYITDFAFKTNTDATYIKDRIDPVVLEKMKRWGYRVQYFDRSHLPDDLPKFVRLKDADEGVYIIKYPHSSRIQKELQNTCDQVNQLIRSRAPPEYITAVAVQNILALHPFADGNGRTARLFGQVLYKKLTGQTLILSDLFKKEMSHSIEDLVASIVRGVQVENPFHHKFMGKAAKFDDIIRYAVFEQKVPLEVIGAEKAAHVVPDLSFNKVMLRPNGEEKYFNYAELPDSVKLANYQGDLFYGANYPSEAEALGSAKAMFTKGRSRQTLDNVDVEAHVGNTKLYESSFIQTTQSPKVAQDFADRKQYGVIYVIDPTDAELLDVNAFYKFGGENNALSMEREILLFGNLNPKRIKGAYVIENKGMGQKIHKVWVNPHYGLGSN